jgi:hypothetical protein
MRLLAYLITVSVAAPLALTTRLGKSPALSMRFKRISNRFTGQALVGPVQHRFEHVGPQPGQYDESDISPYFWHNRQYPDSDEYKALSDGGFAEYRLSRTTNRSPSNLHPGLVGPRQMGRRLRVDDPRSRQAATDGENGRSSTPSATGQTKASTTTRT